MTTNGVSEKKPLWLLIEEEISAAGDHDLHGGNLEILIQRMAQRLDGTGYNVTRNGGNLLQLRWAVDDRQAVGRPLMHDLTSSISKLKLEDLDDPHRASAELVAKVGGEWPRLKLSERRDDILNLVKETKLELLIHKAREISGEEGIRLLIEEDVLAATIIEALDIPEEELVRVNTLVEEEGAERDRVGKLLDEVAEQSDDARVKFLVQSDVADNLIVELAGVEQSAVDAVKQTMEEELKEKKRLEEEEAARKAAEAAGPSVDDIASDEMLEFIESIREILDFSDVEKEIRAMCAQSNIPNSLVDIAVSEPDRLDELEAKAEG